MGPLTALVAASLAGIALVCAFPVGTTPNTLPHGSEIETSDEWSSSKILYASLPALAFICTAVGFIFGCTWCYRHKDCKPSEPTGNQLFSTSAVRLNEGSASRRSQPPDSGFSEPSNNNISEDNNNGPISMREMQNIANNNAAVYIVSENEERNRAASRESVVEFEPLPAGIGAAPDPLGHCADWFERDTDEVLRTRLQYLREIGRGWFGRIVEGDIETGDEDETHNTVAVKILNQNASLNEKARFLDEARLHRELRHDNVLPLLHHCLREEPWMLMFEMCLEDLQQYLITNRPKMAILNESGVLLRLKCDIAAGLAYIHSHNYLYGNLWSGNLLVRGNGETARAVLGRYVDTPPPTAAWTAPELEIRPTHTINSEIWSLGVLLWELCSWAATPTEAPMPEPVLPCSFRAHLYQVMQLCWNTNPELRPTTSQVHALLNHLYTSHQQSNQSSSLDDGYGSSDFEDRWQRLKPNSIPKVDEHVAIVHAPSISAASHFTGSDQEFDDTAHTVQDTLSIDLDTAVSRSSSIMSDKDPLSVHIKSASLTNLHGSLEDVRNIYLNHSESTIAECQFENIPDRDSASSETHKVDPWLKDIIAGSHDDVSYYRDVSDVIKNLDNILNSEKTSSSESSHQASPSRDNLTLDCKKEFTMQSNLVKSPGISNFQNIFDASPEHESNPMSPCVYEDVDRETIGTLDHSFERHSDTISQNTLENLTPESPHLYIQPFPSIENVNENICTNNTLSVINESKNLVPKLKDLCLTTVEKIDNDTEKCSSITDINLSEKILNNEQSKELEIYLNLEQNDISLKSEHENDQTNAVSMIVRRTEELSNACHTLVYPSELLETSEQSTVYMDLINDTNKNVINNSNLLSCNVTDIDDKHVEHVSTIVDTRNESTVYLDLPSMINETHKLLDTERQYSAHDHCVNDVATFKEAAASTPKGSDVSMQEDTLDMTALNLTFKDNTTEVQPKVDQKPIPEILSPFDSPTKSHPTDTFEENSSVVLGPFESCFAENFKVGKPSITPTSEYSDIPREELLAFSSNFTDLNLETPSPLRDSNFLNEVPDIDVHEDDKLDNIEVILGSGTSSNVNANEMCKRQPSLIDSCNLDLPPLSPTTPPNSPGNFLSASPEHKYVVENIADPLHDNLPDPVDENDQINREIDLNQIELQLTTKLAMAENENNLNIEYAGPLTVEELETRPLPIDQEITDELFLCGNGEVLLDQMNSHDQDTSLAESMRALRNELELKLPLAQSVNIEPPAEDDDAWSGELPPPPELVVNYTCLLSPIMEETGHQLSAYENDRPWNVSNRTDSSESYLEPCNISTDEITELPLTGAQTATRDDPTYTVNTDSNSQPSIENNTYTIQKDSSTKEDTMSPDSLNETDVDSKTYVVEEPDDNEKISQVSPFLASPTTDTSVPDNYQSDNVTGVSTLSNTSGPANAKSSKPSETQCLSKTTSIDSWCSNDTLYNVEDNFDDIPIDPDLPPTEDNSNSSQTLTHNDEEDELSRCPTYIIHNSQSEDGDSLTLNSMTYTKLKNENDDKSSASVLTKLETNDNITTSTKNSPTKDVAYETLASSNSPIASYSNCTTAAFSGPNDPWKLYQPPEMVCKSLAQDVVISTPPRVINDDGSENPPEAPPNANCDITINQMESINENGSNDNLFEDHEEEGISSKKNNDLISDESSCKQNKYNTTEDAISKENKDVSKKECVLDASHQHESTNVANSTENTSVKRENISESNMCSIDASTLSCGYAEFQDSVRLKPQTFDSPSLFSQASENGSDVALESNELLLKHVYGNNQFLHPDTESNSDFLTYINTSVNSCPWQTLQPAYTYNHSIDPVRRSPVMDDFNISFTKIDVDKNEMPPELNNFKPEMHKIESIEISCYNDHPIVTQNDIQDSEDLNKSVSIENHLSDMHKCETKSLIDTKNHTVPNVSETFQSPKKIISNSIENSSLQPDGINESNLGSIDASTLSSGYAEFQDSVRLKPQTLNSSSSSQKLDCDSDIIKPENAEYLEKPKNSQNQLLNLDNNSETEYLSDVLVNDAIDMSSSQSKSLENDFKYPPNMYVPTINKSGSNNILNKDAHLPLTSTPLTETQDDAAAAKVISLDLPSVDQNNSKIPNFEKFFQSAEIRPQEISPVSNFIGSDIQQNCVPAISSHRHPANYSSVTDNSINSTDEFHKFENSVRACPQDLSGIDESETLDFDASGQVHSSALFNETKFNPDLTSITVIGNTQDDISIISRTKNPVVLDVSGAVVKTDLGWDESRIFPCYVTNDTLSTNQTQDGFVPDLIKPNNLERTDKLKDPLLNEELHTSKVDTSHELTPNINKSDLENITFNSHENGDTYNSHNRADNKDCNMGINESSNDNFKIDNDENSIIKNSIKYHNEDINQAIDECRSLSKDEVSIKDDKEISNISYINENIGKPQKYATVNYLSTPFEELVESNVDDNSIVGPNASPQKTDYQSDNKPNSNLNKVESQQVEENAVCFQNNDTVEKSGVTAVTKDFLTQEKKFCQLSAYIPLLTDIRFTGPRDDCMSTSFSQESTTEEKSYSDKTKSKINGPCVSELVKEWDSDSEQSYTSNSSSGEFIWKDGDGHVTSVVPSTRFQHQGGGNNNGQSAPRSTDGESMSGSGSEGDELEFVPSSWDCRAAPAKSSLRSLEQANNDNKKRVVFKRQKYHCVYEYPREVSDCLPSPYLPDYSTYNEWDAASAEEAEIGYGQLFASPSHDLYSGLSYDNDYDEDFFISSTARPFEPVGVLATSSQFFPGVQHALKAVAAPRDLLAHLHEPPAPLTTRKTPSLDLTTPDSGVEDVTPTVTDKIASDAPVWRPLDSASSSESVSPSSPGEMGGLRHTRDKLKLELPPSPHLPSPRHSRVFNFTLDKPTPRQKPSDDEAPATDDPPVATDQNSGGNEVTDGEEPRKKGVEAVKGEGTVLDSGDEDSGIESSAKASLERNRQPTTGQFTSSS